MEQRARKGVQRLFISMEEGKLAALWSISQVTLWTLAVRQNICHPSSKCLPCAQDRFLAKSVLVFFKQFPTMNKSPCSLPRERDSTGAPLIIDLLPDEIDGVRSTFVFLSPGAISSEPVLEMEDQVFLILSGNGRISAGGKEYLVEGQKIAHFPLGWPVEVMGEGEQGVALLVLHLALTRDDLEDLTAYDERCRHPYLKGFQECETYGEKIKSPKTCSRTLLPHGIVPRMAIGTVETTGPDQVALHCHPMLEQYFLGLEDNDITVIADGKRIPLKADELFHIPLGSNHGAAVEEGCRLNYLWIDFFHDRSGLEWLKNHMLVTP